MLKFALKNMAIKKVQIILIVISIVISAGVGVLAFNVSEQVSSGLMNNAGYYSAIIGPSGSATQLAMNTMYFSEEPVGTIPYEIVNELKHDSRVKSVVPFAMADNYDGFSVVGTTPEYLSGKELAEGEMFDENGVFTVVVGSKVAELCELHIGSEIYTSHSATGGELHNQPLTVVGILEESHSGCDKIVFTQLETLWKAHEHSDEDEHEEAGEEHDHEENTVCSILVKATNPSTALQIVNEYNGKLYEHDGESHALQAIDPMSTMKGVLEETDNTKYIVFVLCAIILVMNIIIISIITLLNMYNSAKEIALMRLIGISMKKINLLYLIQNAIIGFISTLLAFGLSRLCLLFMGDYVESMGATINMSAVYPLEMVILVGVFLISVIPTVICTVSMSKKDGLNN